MTKKMKHGKLRVAALTLAACLMASGVASAAQEREPMNASGYNNSFSTAEPAYQGSNYAVGYLPHTADIDYWVYTPTFTGSQQVQFQTHVNNLRIQVYNQFGSILHSRTVTGSTSFAVPVTAGQKYYFEVVASGALTYSSYPYFIYLN